MSELARIPSHVLEMFQKCSKSYTKISSLGLRLQALSPDDGCLSILYKPYIGICTVDSTVGGGGGSTGTTEGL